MVEAKLLRKKLKNGLILDKWDLVTIIEKQQAEIDKVNAEWVQAAMALGACVQENHSLKAENEELSALCVEFNVLRKASEK